MADNVAITAGTGTNIATDDVSGNHFQKVKLADGAADSSAMIGGDAANGLDVDVTRIAAGDNNIGNVDIVTLPADVAVADDAAFTPATTKVVAAGCLLDDTTTDKVDEGDVGVARMTADRRQIVAVGETGPNLVTGTASATGTGDTSVIAAPGSGSFLYITSIVAHNSSTTDAYVTIKDGTTARLVLPAPAKGGCVISLPTPLRLSDNAALQFASSGSITTMYVSAVGYKATA